MPREAGDRMPPGSGACAPRCAAVVLDVDSTVAGLEGIDWLARHRGDAAVAAVAELTAQAMDGRVRLEEVYGRRLAIIRPSRGDVEALARAYLDAVTPDAASVVARMLGAGVRVVLVSGGLRPALLPLATSLGIPPDDVHAIGLHFDESGEYAGFEQDSPLTTQTGKLDIVRSLALPAPALMVGDGATDLAARPAVQAFAAYTGFITREAVVREADHRLTSFRELERLVFGGDA